MCQSYLNLQRCQIIDEKAKVYLMTPVRKAGYIDKTQVTENMVFAGETAFSAAQCDTRIKAVAINQNTGKTDVF